MTCRPPLAQLALLAFTAALAAPSAVSAQSEITGVVIDVESDSPVPDVTLRLQGTGLSAVSDAEGRFMLGGVPEGDWTLNVTHVAYGTQEHQVTVGEGIALTLQVRIAPDVIELAPLVVEGETTLERERRTTGSSFWEVTRPEIQRAIGTSRHLGDLIRQTIPGLHLRQSNQISGADVCLEFRNAATISLVNGRPCNHPMVVVDGVRVSDPNYLYGTIGLGNLDRIQVIPPSEAGTRYGTGSLYGVILIETARPGHVGARGDLYRPVGATAPRRTFDWGQEPVGHRTSRAFAGAAVGNVLGLVAGLALARRCITVENEEIESSCGSTTNFAAASSAFLLPAVGSALGSRIGGGSERSVGSPVAALVAAGVALVPGYAFSLTTAGGDQGTVNSIGNAFLVVGVPVAVTIADRLFRELR